VLSRSRSAGKVASAGRAGRRPALAAVVAGALAASLLTACASNKPTSTAISPAGGGATATGSVAADPAIAALVPASVKIGGKLVVGVDTTYAPNEYIDPATGKVVGFDIDLFDAVAARMGLQTRYVTADFSNIIPGVQTGKYSIGVSSFTDSKTREAQVDFVDYFSAGTQWASQAGKAVDPNNACGLKVAVQTGTVEASPDVPDRSKACTAAGKPAITIQPYTSQGDATTALTLGKVDALAADSPITAYALKQTGGKLQFAGAVYDAAPYGYAISKSAGTFKQAVQRALQAIIDDGTYARVCAQWGDAMGEIKSATVNGATS
jgi:polar amino acid transport system substrate-binding protein